MRGKKAKRLRREFREVKGRPPVKAALGGNVTRFVSHQPEKGKPPPRLWATLFEKVVYPSEWRWWKKNQHK